MIDDSETPDRTPQEAPQDAQGGEIAPVPASVGPAAPSSRTRFQASCRGCEAVWVVERGGRGRPAALKCPECGSQQVGLSAAPAAPTAADAADLVAELSRPRAVAPIEGAAAPPPEAAAPSDAVDVTQEVLDRLPDEARPHFVRTPDAPDEPVATPEADLFRAAAPIEGSPVGEPVNEHKLVMGDVAEIQLEQVRAEQAMHAERDRLNAIYALTEFDKEDESNGFSTWRPYVAAWLARLTSNNKNNVAVIAQLRDTIIKQQPLSKAMKVGLRQISKAIEGNMVKVLPPALPDPDELISEVVADDVVAVKPDWRPTLIAAARVDPIVIPGAASSDEEVVFVDDLADLTKNPLVEPVSLVAPDPIESADKLREIASLIDDLEGHVKISDDLRSAVADLYLIAAEIEEMVTVLNTTRADADELAAAVASTTPAVEWRDAMEKLVEDLGERVRRLEQTNRGRGI